LSCSQSGYAMTPPSLSGWLTISSSSPSTRAPPRAAASAAAGSASMTATSLAPSMLPARLRACRRPMRPAPMTPKPSSCSDIAEAVPFLQEPQRCPGDRRRVVLGGILFRCDDVPAAVPCVLQRAQGPVEVDAAGPGGAEHVAADGSGKVESFTPDASEHFRAHVFQ